MQDLGVSFLNLSHEQKVYFTHLDQMCTQIKSYKLQTSGLIWSVTSVAKKKTKPLLRISYWEYGKETVAKLMQWALGIHRETVPGHPTPPDIDFCG